MGSLPRPTTVRGDVVIDPRILRTSLESVLAMDDTFPRRFYEILFEHHPNLKALFVRASPGAQRKMFAQKLCAIVDHLTDDDWLTRELRSLRDAHDRYGVTPEMYAWVGDALIATLQEALGAEFTPEVDANWREAYSRLAATILGNV
jgi:hemoglobin-like flavoprotein